MNKQDNLNDNIYLVLEKIKLLRDTLILDIDPELFFEKTLEDIDFIDRALETLFQRLGKNQRLNDREELFSHFSEAEWQFFQVLSGITKGGGSISSAGIPAIQDRMLALRQKSLGRREKAETIVETGPESPREPVMTTSELNELLKDF